MMLYAAHGLCEPTPEDCCWFSMYPSFAAPCGAHHGREHAPCQRRLTLWPRRGVSIPDSENRTPVQNDSRIATGHFVQIGWPLSESQRGSGLLEAADQRAA